MHLCFCTKYPGARGGGRDRGGVRGVRMIELDVRVGVRGRVGGAGYILDFVKN